MKELRNEILTKPAKQLEIEWMMPQEVGKNRIQVLRWMPDEWRMDIVRGIFRKTYYFNDKNEIVRVELANLYKRIKI